MNRTTQIIIGLCLCLTIQAAPKAKKEVYIPMDYSTCGYHASEQAIPDVKTAVYVAWQEGDCTEMIQQAIDQVAQQKVDANGHRGAILLGEGVFELSKSLRISTSGIVLRGMGKTKTTLVKYGADRGAIIYIEAEGKNQSYTQVSDSIVSQKVTAGSISLQVSRDDYQVGERIRIVRPCTQPWILSLKMNDFGGGLDYTGWKPTDIDIIWDRTITAVSGTTITLDAPITTTITQEYGGASILRNINIEEITECGIEDMTLQAAVNDYNPKDEDHCWDGLYINKLRDGWVRRINFRHLAGSAVNLQKETSRITVEDCIAQDPVSEIGGWRRQVFLTRGQQTLFQRCISRQGIHDFAAGFCAAGPMPSCNVKAKNRSDSAEALVPGPQDYSSILSTSTVTTCALPIWNSFSSVQDGTLPTRCSGNVQPPPSNAILQMMTIRVAPTVVGEPSRATVSGRAATTTSRLAVSSMTSWRNVLERSPLTPTSCPATLMPPVLRR